MSRSHDTQSAIRNALVLVSLSVLACGCRYWPFPSSPPPSSTTMDAATVAGAQDPGIADPRPIFRSAVPTFPTAPDRLGDKTRGSGTATPTHAVHVDVSPAPLSLPSTPRDENFAVETSEDTERRFRQRLEELTSLLAKVDSGVDLETYERVRRAAVEKELIALFFLDDRKHHTEYRDLLDAFSEYESGIPSLEILKAALFQELGLVKQRDRALARVAPPKGSGTLFKIERFEVSSPTPGTPQSGGSAGELVFSRGQEVVVSGDFEQFETVTTASFGGRLKKFRHSFSASVALYNLDGDIIERRPILVPGGKKTMDLSTEPKKKIRFWGHYRLPSQLTAGGYLLELVAIDLEGKAVSSSQLEISVR